jgi:hypothetical protein
VANETEIMWHVIKMLVNVYEMNFRGDFMCVCVCEQGLLKVNTFNKINFLFNTFLFPSIISPTLYTPLHDYYCCTVSSPLSSSLSAPYCHLHHCHSPFHPQLKLNTHQKQFCFNQLAQWRGKLIQFFLSSCTVIISELFFMPLPFTSYATKNFIFCGTINTLTWRTLLIVALTWSSPWQQGR